MSPVVWAFGDVTGAPWAFVVVVVDVAGGGGGGAVEDAVAGGGCEGRFGMARGMVETSRSVLRREFVSLGLNGAAGAAPDVLWSWFKCGFGTVLAPCCAFAAFSHASLAFGSTGQAETEELSELETS